MKDNSMNSLCICLLTTLLCAFHSVAQSKSETWEIKQPTYHLKVSTIDSVQYYKVQKKLNIQPQALAKITDLDSAKKMLAGIVEFKPNNPFGALRRINYRNGDIYTDFSNENGFVAYYPTEDILMLEGGHATDVSFNLTNGYETSATGNPAYIITSPNKHYRLNGLYDGQERVHYFIQKRINGQFEIAIPLSVAFEASGKARIFYISNAFWSDDATLWAKATFNWDEQGNPITKYYKINIQHATPILPKTPILRSKQPLDFVPEGYIIYTEEYQEPLVGDLNKDGLTM